MLKFPDDVQDDVQKRLRRLEGQIRGLQAMLEDGKDCRDVITQLSAAKSALDRIGYRLVGAGMRYCVTNADEADGITSDELEKLFLKIS
ncbi:MAG: metal-sensitive transcriptional regulator [Acidimicrobiia bacterium]|nr:metal-sensitive transcriptional regulator [Acidimicrobiia bacterium]